MASNSTFFTRDASFSFGMEDQLWFGGRGVGGGHVVFALKYVPVFSEHTPPPGPRSSGEVALGIC